MKRVISVILLFFLISGSCLMDCCSADAAEVVMVCQGVIITDMKMEIGDRAEVSAFPSTAFNGEIMWMSSDEKVAEVSGRGASANIWAVGGGTCNIRATDGKGSEVSLKITVGSFKVPSYLDMGVGMKMPLYEGSADGKIKVSVKKKKICSVNKKGIVKAKKAGKTNVVVKANGRTFKCEVRVNKVRFDESHKIQMVAVGGNFDAPLKYASALNATVKADNPDIVSFDGLKGTGLKQGYTDYTITCGKKSYTGTIYVIDDVSCPFVMQADDEIHIKRGDTISIPIFGAYFPGFNWSGSNKEIANVAFEQEDVKVIPYGVGMNSWYADFKIFGLSEGSCDLTISVKGTVYKKLKIYVE